MLADSEVASDGEASLDRKRFGIGRELRRGDLPLQGNEADRDRVEEWRRRVAFVGADGKITVDVSTQVSSGPANLNNLVAAAVE